MNSEALEQLLVSAGLDFTRIVAVRVEPGWLAHVAVLGNGSSAIVVAVLLGPLAGALVPDGGLTGAALRRLSLPNAVAQAASVTEGIDIEASLKGVVGHRRARRRPRGDDVLYRLVALAYLDAQQADPRPRSFYSFMADRLADLGYTRYTPDQMRDLVGRATKLDFLTGAPKKGQRGLRHPGARLLQDLVIVRPVAAAVEIPRPHITTKRRRGK